MSSTDKLTDKDFITLAECARKLGMTEHTLYRKLKTHDMRRWREGDNPTDYILRDDFERLRAIYIAHGVEHSESESKWKPI